MSTSKLKPYKELYNFIHENKLTLVVTVTGCVNYENYVVKSTKISEFSEKYYRAIKSLVDNFLNNDNMHDINNDYSEFAIENQELFDYDTVETLIGIPFSEEDGCYVETITDIKLSFESDYFQIEA